MKNLLIASLVAALAFAPAVPAFAETSSGVSASASSSVRVKPVPPLGQKVKELIHERNDNIKEVRKENASSTKAEVKEIRADFKLRLDTIKEDAKKRWGERAHKHVRAIVEHLASTTDKLENLAVRIDAQIKVHIAAGKTMASSTALLAQAKADIALADSKVAAVSAAIEAALQSSNPKEHMGEVRKAVKAAQEAIHKAKESLRKTLHMVRVEAGVRAETSVQ